MMVLLWAMVGLALLLRRYEGAIPVRSTVAMLSGALVAGFVVLDASQEAGAHRAADLDQGQVAYAYDLTTIGFTNVWLAMGSFALACGWVIVSTKAMPRWLGRWGVVGGIAVSLTQFVWKNEVAWLVLYIPFWPWLVTTWVLLVRRRSAMVITPSRGAQHDDRGLAQCLAARRARSSQETSPPAAASGWRSTRAFCCCAPLLPGKPDSSPWPALWSRPILGTPRGRLPGPAQPRDDILPARADHSDRRRHRSADVWRGPDGR